MTKESLILFWLSTHRPDKWMLRVELNTFIYTFRKGDRVTTIEYTEPTELSEVECVVRDRGEVEYFGTVESCLDYLKKRAA